MRVIGLAVASVVLVAASPSIAMSDLQTGEKAELFRTVDEDLRPVDMAGMIDGRPLVLAVGSCS